MRKTALVILLLCLCTEAYNQIIQGTIRDQNSDSTINFASVYFNGTFVGTHSDRYGRFTLDISNNRSMPLTVSALGYFSVTITDFSAGKPFAIYLEPKIFELNEVVISASAKAMARARKENMRLFKTQFLGTTLNSLKCDIINEDDISLVNNSVTETLRAFSSHPIIIENRALGYHLSYYLDNFEYCRSTGSLKLTGNCLFKDDSTSTKAEQQNFNRKRKTAYLGSRMHFFRELWKNSFDSTGYVVKSPNNDILKKSQFVFQSDSIVDGVHPQFLRYEGSLNVSYYSKTSDSRILVIDPYVYFDKDGYFEPLGISWEGKMSLQRIADLLPFEYSVK
jgi:hypothetical protein